MSKSQFLAILKESIKHRTKKQTAPCRCADCYNAKQKCQDNYVVKGYMRITLLANRRK